ncbi:MAG TPA: DUF559 domain-containing protein [Pseudolysinimonas sp.]|jgi:hypothetical protein
MPAWSTAELRQAGVTRAALARLVHGARLIRVRAGWYVSVDTHPDVVEAVRAGGSLTCRAALRHHGVWTVPGATHVRIGPHDRRLLPDPPLHRLAGTASGGIDDLPTALRAAARCLPAEQLVCAIDSILNAEAMSLSDLEGTLDSPRGRRLIGLADGRSQSGLETLARLRLRSRGLRLRIQMQIGTVGRVDILIGDRLIIELDGDEWHSTAQQRETDRRRDSALIALGYLVMRAG